jgi:SecD/SecF fusion protein
MSPTATFFYGLLLLVLFCWYFFTDSDRLKRILGTVLTILLTAFCVWLVNPPFDVKDAGGQVVKRGRIPLGLDLQGGTSFLIRLDPPVAEDGAKRAITPDMVDQAVEAIRKRVDAFGVSEPVITPQGSDRILVQIPGLDLAKIEDAREQLRKVAKLEFRLVHRNSGDLVAAIEAGEQIIPIGYAIETMSTERNGKPVEGKLLVKKKADLLGDTITRANAFYDARGWGVHMNFNSEGGKKFGDLTKQVFEENSQMAIVLDGKVISAPGVEKGPIYQGSAEISGGNMSEKEARNLASALQNPLQTPVVIEEERSASASLGADSINSGIYSGLIGVAITFIFVLAYYRLVGLVANIALVINMVLLFGAMAMFNQVLTLPGIAGVILTLGMAIDANVLIYERLREELAAGKNVRAALATAYDKAFTAIFDSNVTTLITALILFWQASGPVRGFAVTLSLGIVASLFTALVVTRNLFAWMLAAGWLKTISMSNLISATNFDFLGKRRAAIGISLVVIAASVGIFAIRGERNFGVDFKGGDRTVLEAATAKPALNEVRAAVEELKIGDAVVNTETSAEKEFFTIRSPKDTGNKIFAQVQAKFPQAGFKLEQLESVGGVVGGELARSSVIALTLGMLGIFLYVTARFEMSFAIGALVALLHDVVITVGVFALLGRELSLVIVGAVLTIAGYSVNDTIVVFDRIREGIQAGRKGSVQSIMNQSINETLSRTILTGGVTLMTTAVLFFFGGPVLNDFALAILVGVLVGTYSSIFVAAPIVLWWSGKSGRDLRTEIKQAEAAKAAASA